MNKYGKPVEVWKAILLGDPSRFHPVGKIFSEFVVASTFEGQLDTFTQTWSILFAALVNSNFSLRIFSKFVEPLHQH